MDRTQPVKPPVPRLLADIAAQPDSLVHVAQHQWGSGHADLLRAAEFLRSAPVVVVVGMGASLNAAVPFENLLCRGGIPAFCVEAGEFLHFRRAAYRHAVVVAISRSGESAEIVKLLDHLGSDVKLVAVTNQPDSTLARRAHVSLDIRSLADEFVAIQTYGGTLLALYILGMAATHRLPEARPAVDTLVRAMPHWTQACLASGEQWGAFLGADAQISCLGRGPSVGSAAQGALLLAEIAKVPAIGMAVATFRHGPVEVVNPRFRGVIFAPNGPARALNIALALDLQKFGGGVRVIGPGHADGRALSVVETPDCDDLLAPLLEIVPMQVAAVKLAQLQGLRVGGMRYSSQVSRDEMRIARDATSP